MVLRLSSDGSKVVAAIEAALATATAMGAVYFTKLRPCRLTSGPTVLSAIAISSVPASPLDSMYSAVHGVYVPALQTTSDEKVRGLLGDLDKALAAAVRKAAAADGGGSGASGFAGIATVCMMSLC